MSHIYFVFFAVLSKPFPQSKEESISFGESLVSFVDFSLVRAYCQFLAIYSIDYKKEIQMFVFYRDWDSKIYDFYKYVMLARVFCKENGRNKFFFYFHISGLS